MFALIENNQVTQVGEPAVLFPNTSGVTSAFAIEQGALEIVEGEQKDQRFYWVTFSHYEVQADKVVRTYTNTPKALDDVTETPEGQTEPVTTQGLKSQYIAQARQAANTQLAQTDWVVVRKAERGVEIPADVAASRAAILAECDRVIAGVSAAATVDELMAVVSPVNEGAPA